MADPKLNNSVRRIKDLVEGRPVGEEQDVNTNAGGLLTRFMKFMGENYPDWFKDGSAAQQTPFPKGGSGG